MYSGMFVVLEVKTNVEHREVEKVRDKYSGVTYRLGGSLHDTSRMLDVGRTCPNPSPTRWRSSLAAPRAIGPLPDRSKKELTQVLYGFLTVLVTGQRSNQLNYVPAEGYCARMVGSIRFERMTFRV